MAASVTGAVTLVPRARTVAGSLAAGLLAIPTRPTVAMLTAGAAVVAMLAVAMLAAGARAVEARAGGALAVAGSLTAWPRSVERALAARGAGAVARRRRRSWIMA